MMMNINLTAGYHYIHWNARNDMEEGDLVGPSIPNTRQIFLLFNIFLYLMTYFS